MKLIAIMPARNEAWILGLSVRQALKWCDALILYNHASTDNTAAVLDGIDAGRLVVVKDDRPQWNEMQHRQYLLQAARMYGATHLAMIDADEVLTENLVPDIRDMVADLPSGSMLQLPGYNLRAGMRYHANGMWSNRWFSLAFLDNLAAHWDGDRFHHREPAGLEWHMRRPVRQGYGGVLHFWGAVERRLRAKHCSYKMTERIRWPHRLVSDIDRMYSWWRSPQDSTDIQKANPWTYTAVPETWLDPELMRYCDLSNDKEPWQEAECRRLIEEHGRDKFAHLDLFGVV